jgi:hypothetical protein
VMRIGYKVLEQSGIFVAPHLNLTRAAPKTSCREFVTAKWHPRQVASTDCGDLPRTVRIKLGRDVDDPSSGGEEANLALIDLVGDDALRAGMDYNIGSAARLVRRNLTPLTIGFS